MYCLSDIMLFHTLQCVNPIGCGGRGATICELSQNLTPFRNISSGSAHAYMLDYFNSRDYCRKSDLLRGKLDPSLHFPRTGNPGSTNLCHPETGDYHLPTLLCQSLCINMKLRHGGLKCWLQKNVIRGVCCQVRFKVRP